MLNNLTGSRLRPSLLWDPRLLLRPPIPGDLQRVKGFGSFERQENCKVDFRAAWEVEAPPETYKIQ